MSKGFPILDQQEESPANEKSSEEFAGRIAVVTLGCAKNQVDSEVMLGTLRSEGFEIVNDLSSADVAVVNTCGFLESAVKESIDCILEVAELKKTARLRKLIVAGCAVERYRTELVKELPEVDNFLSTDELRSVGKVAGSGATKLLHSGARPYLLYDDSVSRVLSTENHTAYLKIAEGCNRPCTFCIIPQIRGAFRSREMDSLREEARQLGSQGVREINLIAQDLTSYGKDRKAAGLSELLRALDADAAVDWIRLLYAYPVGVDKELLKTISGLKRVCNYFDIPLQHVSETLLKEMKRPLGSLAPRPLVEMIKETAPEIAIRTTFIVGFPGETEQDISELEQLVRDGFFSSVGVFEYSPEPGTPAAEMSGQIPEEEKSLRRERIMQAQAEVLEDSLDEYVGQTLTVLLEGAHQDTDLLLRGRAEFQAPEVDGQVIINEIAEERQIKQPVGIFAEVEIQEVAGYDLIGRVVEVEGG